VGRLAARHLPGGPVGSPSRWAATSSVDVGQTIYPLTGEDSEGRGKKGARDKVTETRTGNEKEACRWNLLLLAREGGCILRYLCRGPQVSSYPTADEAGLFI